MNWIDITIAAALLMGLCRGYKMGFIRQLASVFTWIFGFYGAMRFSTLVSTQLSRWVGEKYLAIVSFVVVFLLIAIIVYLMRKSMEWGFRIVWMYRFNRILGACFGLLKSLLYVSASVFFLTKSTTIFG